MLKQFSQITVGIIFLGFGLFTCGGESSTAQDKVPVTPKTTTGTQTSTTAQAAAEPEVKIDWNADELLIQEAGLAGVFIGQPLTTVENRVTKEVLKNGEGEFIAYNFTSKDGTPLGYFLLDPEDSNLIGDVVVTSGKATTKDGIKVGSTFADLTPLAPNIEIHGSEIESRTHAYIGRMAYLLDAAFNTYEVERSQVKPDTRIKAIRLMSHPKKEG